MVDASIPSNDGSTGGGAKIRLLLVDDQPTIRLGLGMILRNEPDLDVVGEAGDGDEAVVLARDLRPDVVLMDVRMPRVSGVQATAMIRSEPSLAKVRIIVLTTFSDEEYVQGALRSGADAFLLKDVDPAVLIDAIHRVHEGGGILSPSIIRTVIDSYAAMPDQGGVSRPNTSDGQAQEVLSRLSEREREIMFAVCKGGTNRQIGDSLGLTEATVKSHLRSILTKLELTNRVQLVILAYETGILNSRPGG